MATPENTFIASIRKHLPKDLYVLKNNNQFHAGVPDLWISGKSADLWIEAKYIILPKRPDTLIKIDLSELQKNWLRSRFDEGRNVAVIVGSPKGGVYLEGVSWDYTHTAESFLSLLKTRQELAKRITQHCLQGTT